MSRMSRFMAMVSAVCVLSHAAQSADCTWTGLGGDARWANALNWDGNTAPAGNADQAIFPAGTPTACTVDASASIKCIYFRNPGMTLTVSSGVNLSFDNPGAPTIIAEQDVTISGAGTLSSGTGTLFYEGAGKITLALANTYTTPTTIKAGSTVVAQHNAAFGTADSGTTIEAGGTLDVGGSLGNNALNLGAEVFTVSGSGVGSNGAIVNNGANSQMQTFGRVEMAGDTTFGGNQRWDLRNNSAYLHMNGYNLTKVGNNNVVFVNTTVTPGTGNIDITSGFMQLEGGTRLNGSSTNTLHVASGATLMYWYLTDDATATPWSLVLENLSKFRVDGGSANQDIWRGPVTLNGLVRLDPNNFHLYINGAISGTGSIDNVSGGYSYLNNTNNTYSGTTTASSGAICASDPGSLPGYASGQVTVKSGGAIAVRVSNGTAGWTLPQIQDLVTATAFTAPDATLGIDTSLADMNYGYTLPVYKLGTGTLTLNTPGQTLNGQIKAGGGELVMDGTAINATNVESHIGIYGGESAKVTLSGSTAWSSIQPAKNVWCPILYVGESGKGVLAIKDNASLTHRFNVGQNGGSAGAVYQSGGTVTNWGGASNDIRIGQNGYGYYELGGGSLTFKGWSQLGVAPSGMGILKVSGGSFTQLSDFDGTLGISRGGTGVVYVTGGTFTTASSDLWVGDQYENSASGGFADFTLAGGIATVNGGTGIQMANRDNMKAMVNLNGGVLEANQIRKEIRNTSLATVGFNGGTFRARTSGAYFGTGSYAPDAVSLYAGGATFDTTN
jgi:autotransporter-associated beta strand protein